MRRVDDAPLVGPDEHGRPVLLRFLVDEVADRPVERPGQLEQRGDGGDHPRLLDLVDGGGRHVGPLAQLLERQPPLEAEVPQLRADRADDPLQGRTLGFRRCRALRCSHPAPS